MDGHDARTLDLHDGFDRGTLARFVGAAAPAAVERVA